MNYRRCSNCKGKGTVKTNKVDMYGEYLEKICIKCGSSGYIKEKENEDIDYTSPDKNVKNTA